MAVNNYLFKYADGTTGNSPYRRDAAGNIVLNAAGGIADVGSFMGRSMPDGSINQSPIGNVTANGMVDTYGGYQTTADNYYSNANEAAWGRPSNAGQRPPDGYGYGSLANGLATQMASGAATGPAAGPSTGGAPVQAPGVAPPGGSASMPGQNPYLQQLGDQMTQQVTQNMQRNVLPGIASQAMAAGGYGGSRQGVIESNAMRDMNNSLASGLTNLYSRGYNQNLQYDLGLRGNDLGFAGLDAQINQNNFNNRLQGANFGLGLWNQGMANNQTGINAGTNIQNTPMNYWSQFGNQYNSIGQGFGTTTGSASQQGNPMMGMLGGAQLGSRFAQGWGNTAGSASDTANGTNFWAPNFSGSMGD